MFLPKKVPEERQINLIKIRNAIQSIQKKYEKNAELNSHLQLAWTFVVSAQKLLEKDELSHEETKGVRADRDAVFQNHLKKALINLQQEDFKRDTEVKQIADDLRLFQEHIVTKLHVQRQIDVGMQYKSRLSNADIIYLLATIMQIRFKPLSQSRDLLKGLEEKDKTITEAGKCAGYVLQWCEAAQKNQSLDWQELALSDVTDKYQDDQKEMRMLNEHISCEFDCKILLSKLKNNTVYDVGIQLYRMDPQGLIDGHSIGIKRINDRIQLFDPNFGIFDLNLVQFAPFYSIVIALAYETSFKLVLTHEGEIQNLEKKEAQTEFGLEQKELTQTQKEQFEFSMLGTIIERFEMLFEIHDWKHYEAGVQRYYASLASLLPLIKYIPIRAKLNEIFQQIAYRSINDLLIQWKVLNPKKTEKEFKELKGPCFTESLKTEVMNRIKRIIVEENKSLTSMFDRDRQLGRAKSTALSTLLEDIQQAEPWMTLNDMIETWKAREFKSPPSFMLPATKPITIGDIIATPKNRLSRTTLSADFIHDLQLNYDINSWHVDVMQSMLLRQIILICQNTKAMAVFVDKGGPLFFPDSVNIDHLFRVTTQEEILLQLKSLHKNELALLFNGNLKVGLSIQKVLSNGCLNEFYLHSFSWLQLAFEGLREISDGVKLEVDKKSKTGFHPLA